MLLLVFNYSSLILMFGGELNSEMAKRYDPSVLADLAANPAKDKGETIYSDTAPKKKPEERESDLKGAQDTGQCLPRHVCQHAQRRNGGTRNPGNDQCRRERRR